MVAGVDYSPIEVDDPAGLISERSASIAASGEDIVALVVDFVVKRPRVSMVTGNTIYMAGPEPNDSELTRIEFVAYPHWRVFSAEVSKYELFVCLVFKA